MSTNPDSCPYWHSVCKSFFESNEESCKYPKEFCMIYYDLKEQEAELQPELLDDSD